MESFMSLIWPPFLVWEKKLCATPPGFEPGIPWFVVRCLIHWATGPSWNVCVFIYSLFMVRVISRSRRLRNHLCFSPLSSLSCFPFFLDFTKAKRRRRLLFIFSIFLCFFCVLLKITTTDHMESFMSLIWPPFLVWEKKTMRDPARTRTWNPLIRSQMPYPLGHGAILKSMRYYILLFRGKGSSAEAEG